LVYKSIEESSPAVLKPAVFPAPPLQMFVPTSSNFNGYVGGGEDSYRTSTTSRAGFVAAVGRKELSNQG